MTELAFVTVGALLVLIPSAMMLLYSKWIFQMAQAAIRDLVEQRSRLMVLEHSVLEGEAELRQALKAQVGQLEALDKSVGHIFGQVMSQSASRTVIRKERQIGEELPPFPGAAPELVNQRRVFPNQEVVATGFVNPDEKPRKDSALAEPS